MYRTTLIATAHKERGNCNTKELYKIIERIDPEVIFEEIAPDGFVAIYEGSGTDSLETYTIKRYLKRYPIAHFPVDLDKNEFLNNRFKNDVSKMFDVFMQNLEYKDLSIQHEILSERYGFPYLNSDQCKKLLERTHILEDAILRMINHAKLSQTHKDWIEINDRRKNEMINNIYNYSDLNRYSRALFLIGVEHRKSIIDKIPVVEKNKKVELNWIFD